MKKYFLIILFILIKFEIISQISDINFTKIGNNSNEHSTDVDTLNKYIYLTGNTNECGLNNGFIIKYKNDSVYKRILISDNNINILESIETKNINEIFVAGYTDKNNNYDILLAKLDTNLDIINKKIINLEKWNFCYDLSMNNSNIIGVGKTHNGQNYDAFMFKANNNLDTIWTKKIELNNNQKLNKVIQYNDTIYIACGYTEKNTTNKDVFIVSFNSQNGDTLWTKNIGGINNDFCNSIIKTQDGGIAGFGTTSSYTSTTEDTYLFKTDSSGTFLWSNLHQVQSPSNTLNERGIDLVELQNGNFVVASYTESFGSIDVKSTMVMLTNNIGDWQNGYIYDGGKDDFPTSIIKMSDTSIFISGIANSNSLGYSDSYIMNLKTVDVNNNINIFEKELENLCFVGIDKNNIKNNKQIIYPNPIKNHFVIKDYINQDVELNIIELYGKKLHNIKTQTNKQIEFPKQLSSGIYILNITYKNNTKTQHKIIYAK